MIFLCTTGDVLDNSQQLEFERYIRRGGGFIGIHSAADTEYGWPWYGGLVGAYFVHHPHIQPALLYVEDPMHSTMRAWPAQFMRIDEWYDFASNPRERVRVLISLVPDSYEGGWMTKDHPITWCQEYDGGRSFYTGFGHTTETYSESRFREMLKDAIYWTSAIKRPTFSFPRGRHEIR